MRFTLDSNVLVYAVDRGTPAKRAIAHDILKRAIGLDLVLTAQALAEFLNVVRRRSPADFPAACEQAQRWATLFPTGSTTWEYVEKAATLAAKHRLQLWDCVIWQSARSLKANLFLSEDLQDGFSMDGMKVLNPFAPANERDLAELLAKGSEGSEAD